MVVRTTRIEFAHDGGLHYRRGPRQSVADAAQRWHRALTGRQVIKVLKVLLISPLIGFVLAGLLILISKRLLKYPGTLRTPKNESPPPWPDSRTDSFVPVPV